MHITTRCSTNQRAEIYDQTKLASKRKRGKKNWIIWHFFNKIHWKAFKGLLHIGKFPKKEEMIVFKISTDMLTVVMTKTEMLLILCVCDYTERLDDSTQGKMEIRERRWL